MLRFPLFTLGGVGVPGLSCSIERPARPIHNTRTHNARRDGPASILFKSI